MSSPVTPTPSRLPPRWAVLAVLLLIALNLRPALASLAPVLKQAQHDSQLGGSAMGLLTTLPVLCFGLIGPLAPRLARRYGSEASLVVLLVLLSLGCALRAAGNSGLFLGTLLAGASIGVANVLMPALLKRDFAGRADLLTGLYTMALCLGAALAAGLTVPLQQASTSWQLALAFWALPALLAAVACAWLWQPWRPRPTAIATPAPPGASLLRDALAWQVTLYMGLQSALAYCVFGWLPVLLQDRGLSALAAGASLSASVLLQMLSALTAPLLARLHVRQGGDQRATIALMLGLTLSGLLGCLLAPLSSLWLWIVLLGLGQGGTFSMALSLIVLRSRDAATAIRLSGMSQSLGYSLAALGPLAVGLLHEAQAGALAQAALFSLISTAALFCGLRAGRHGFVGRANAA